MAVSKLKTRFAIMRKKLGPMVKVGYLLEKSGFSDSWFEKVSCGQIELQYEKALLFQGITGFSAEWLMGKDVPMMVEKTMSDTQATDKNLGVSHIPFQNMTLRDWFAGQALPSVINSAAFYEQKAEEELIQDQDYYRPWGNLHSKKDDEALASDAFDIAFAAYRIADAMIDAKGEESND